MWVTAEDEAAEATAADDDAGSACSTEGAENALTGPFTGILNRDDDDNDDDDDEEDEDKVACVSVSVVEKRDSSAERDKEALVCRGERANKEREDDDDALDAGTAAGTAVESSSPISNLLSKTHEKH